MIERTDTQLVKKKYRIGRDAVLIFVVSLLLFSTSLVQQSFYPFETQWMLSAHTLSAKAWPIFLSHHAHSRFLLALPNALCSALTLVLIYLTAAPHSRKWGFCGILFALSTYLFFFSARSAGTAPCLMLLITFAFYLVYAEEMYLFSAKWWWLGIWLIIGFCLAGPMGLILPAAVVGSYYLLVSRWRDFSLFMLMSLAIFVLGVWMVFHQAFSLGGMPALQHWFMHMFAGKTFTATPEPFYYYALHALSWYALSYPIALLVLVGLLSHMFELTCGKRIKFIQCLTAWALIVLVIYSIQPYKDLKTLLPLVPACALIAAYLFIDEEQPVWLKVFRKIIAFILFISPFICALITLFTKNLARHRLHENFHAHYITVFILLLFLQIVAMIYGLAKHRSRKESMGLLVATLSFIVVFILVVEPALLLKTTLSF